MKLKVERIAVQRNYNQSRNLKSNTQNPLCYSNNTYLSKKYPANYYLSNFSVSFKGAIEDYNERFEEIEESVKERLNENIGGYNKAKSELNTFFITPVLMEKEGFNTSIPNSILLFGDMASGKRHFALQSAKETDSKLIEMHPEPEEFIKDISKELKEARQRYIDTKQRTIILIKDADELLDDSKKNRRCTSYMRCILNSCAELPSDDNTNACATTFLFTTNSPQKINSDILFDKNRINQVIKLQPARNNNLSELMSFYLNQYIHIPFHY